MHNPALNLAPFSRWTLRDKAAQRRLALLLGPMSAHLSREDYVSACRQKSVAICLGILSGTTDVLEGCHTLASLRFEVQVSEGDEDFNVFGAISSETDALPVGAVRTHWAPEALARIQPEIDAAVSWALPLAIPACTSVVQRFGPNYSLKRTNQSLRD